MQLTPVQQPLRPRHSSVPETRAPRRSRCAPRVDPGADGKPELTPAGGRDTFPCMSTTRVCATCLGRSTCTAICAEVEALLPSMEAGRIDHEDLPRLWRGMMFTRAILDHESILAGRQREVVRLYYREQKEQKEIAALLGVTQQAVNDALERARARIGGFLKGARKRRARG